MTKRRVLLSIVVLLLPVVGVAAWSAREARLPRAEIEPDAPERADPPPIDPPVVGSPPERGPGGATRERRAEAPGEAETFEEGRRSRRTVSLGPNLERIEADRQYCSMPGSGLRMDVYHPKRHRLPTPAVLFVHGGGWRSGDKAAGVNPYTAELVERGYLVASVNYRLAPQHRFPAQIQDVKCAVRHLRASASELGLDGDRIGAMGVSAGGHLSALLGLAGEGAGFDVGQYNDVSSSVRAVADFWGPSDLTSDAFGRSGLKAVSETFGSERERGSPLRYVSPSAPPFLIVHGEHDQLVHPVHSERLHAALTEAGVPSTLTIVKHAGHSLVPAGGTPDPPEPELADRIGDFFDTHLAHR